MIFSHVLYQLSYLAIKERRYGVAVEQRRIAKNDRNPSISREFRRDWSAEAHTKQRREDVPVEKEAF